MSQLAIRKKQVNWFIAMLFSISLISASSVYAHSGGLNAAGCHAGSQPYHCHRGTTVQRVQPFVSDGRDRNCSDFRSWREAQDFFLAAGYGDPHGLDRDNDGIACESLR